ncbi:MAG: ATP-binding protein [Myxococcales bacterium]|nr:ATP-binding protein [Myxococcales bacterium]
MAWRWHAQGGSPPPSAGPLLPDPRDRLLDALDRGRYLDEQRRFFTEDPTGRYLSDEIAAPPPVALAGAAPRGSLRWVAEALDLSPVARFALALALYVSWDSAAGAVIAACSGDPAAERPTLALIQRLWDDPREVLEIADPAHPLFTRGLLQRGEARGLGIGWEQAIWAPQPVTRRLLAPELGPPPALAPIAEPPPPGSETRGLAALADELSGPPAALRVIPVLAPPRLGASVAAAACAAAGRRLLAYLGPAEHLALPGHLDGLAAAAWLDDADLLVDAGALPVALEGGRRLPLSSLPLRLFLVADDRRDLTWLSGHITGPALEVLPPPYGARLDAWRRGLGPRFAALEEAASVAAHRYRLDAGAIAAIADRLGARPEAPSAADLEAACAGASPQGRLDASGLAERIEPRFGLADLVLPDKQSAQIGEVRRAVAALPRAYGAWGLGRALGEPGISALFAGPPGTGKTMAAECLAADLELPIYRVDLSQVVSKYIGETEKNLREVFAAAEARDLVLFFDEADAIFGKRTEVRDAHDRYANLEVAYLLARMERAQGLMILATNRKEDLDPAFLRRLRFIVDFPMPGPDERRRIWERVIPPAIERQGLDLNFLARRFELSGGTIRAAALAACLQSAAEGGPPALRMEHLVLALWRELDKLGRALSPAIFGPFAGVIADAEQGARGEEAGR